MSSANIDLFVTYMNKERCTKKMYTDLGPNTKQRKSFRETDLTYMHELLASVLSCAISYKEF